MEKKGDIKPLNRQRHGGRMFEKYSFILEKSNLSIKLRSLGISSCQTFFTRESYVLGPRKLIFHSKEC